MVSVCLSDYKNSPRFGRLALRLLALRLLALLLLASSLAGCGGLRNLYRQSVLEEPDPSFTTNRGLYQLDARFACLAGGVTSSNKCPVADDTANVETPDSYYEAAILVSQTACNRFLDNIVMAQRADRFSRSSLSTAGGFTAGLLGITRASAKAIAIVAASLASLDTLFQNFEDTLLFMPYAETLYPVVKQEQQQRYIDGKIALAAAPGTPARLRAFLARRYAAEQAQSCTISGIQALLGKIVRVGAASVGVSTTTPLLPNAELAAALLQTSPNPRIIALTALVDAGTDKNATAKLAALDAGLPKRLEALRAGNPAAYAILQQALAGFRLSPEGSQAIRDASRPALGVGAAGAPAT